MEERKIAIQATGVEKVYKLYDKPSDRLKEALGLSGKKKYREHYALKGVDMTIYQGEVIVQTFNPDHYAITLAKNHDYIDFYKEEMKVRKMLKYSPYYYMVLVSITSKDYELGFKEANKIGSYIRNNISSDSIVLGPTMANMFKVNNIYHYQIIIKYRKDDSLMKVLKFIIDMQVKNNKIDVSIDFNPSRI